MFQKKLLEGLTKVTFASGTSRSTEWAIWRPAKEPPMTTISILAGAMLWRRFGWGKLFLFLEGEALSYMYSNVLPVYARFAVRPAS